MCGIWAIFGSDVDVAVQSQFAHRIKHRGPDAFRIETINHFPNCCLAVHRLSIVDELHGMQPLRIHKYPNLVLIYNGEIYNHKKIKDQYSFDYVTECDGECIIHLFVKGGIEFAVRQLGGVFAFCLLDITERMVYLSRDTFGVKPMFRVHTRGLLALCSEAKGIIGLFKEGDGKVQHLPPGHVETYRIKLEGKAMFVKGHRFHNIGEAPVYRTIMERTDTDVEANIRMFLEAAVDKRMMSDRRIGCLLSGGIDSSLVAALVVKKAKEIGLPYNIQTFSVGLEGSTDLIAARKVASYLQTDHHERIFKPEDGFAVLDDVIYHTETYDIMTIRSSVWNYLLCKYIKEHTDTIVLFSGEGSDEITQGYIYFRNAPNAEERETQSKRLCEDLYMFDVLRADRTSSAWGLEVRVPFLDHKFSSFYLSLDTMIKAPRHGIEKYLLRSAFDGQGLLPDEILWRPKEGFSDGVSSVDRSWYLIIHEYMKNQVGNIDKNQMDVQKTGNEVEPPYYKELLYYKTIFMKYYPRELCDGFVPYYWFPKWVQTNDPSSRTIKHYKQ